MGRAWDFEGNGSDSVGVVKDVLRPKVLHVGTPCEKFSRLGLQNPKATDIAFVGEAGWRWRRGLAGRGLFSGGNMFNQIRRGNRSFPPIQWRRRAGFHKYGFSPSGFNGKFTHQGNCLAISHGPPCLRSIGSRFLPQPGACQELARGTNLSLTITTWPLLLADFHFDCAVGVQRVPARLLQARRSPEASERTCEAKQATRGCRCLHRCESA